MMDRPYLLIRDKQVVASFDRAEMANTVFIPGDILVSVLERYVTTFERF